VVALAFGAGVLTPLLYQRWNSAKLESDSIAEYPSTAVDNNRPAQSYPVSFVPLSPALPEDPSIELPALAARDVEKVRGLTGRQAKIRGRIFRVGHSAKSNTYFLNFGPSKDALTAVIFASAAELFEKSKLAPKNYENREVEITGTVKDHPQFGVEIILEDPKQIKIID
jgi:hypothetical protein